MKKFLAILGLIFEIPLLLLLSLFGGVLYMFAMDYMDYRITKVIGYTSVNLVHDIFVSIIFICISFSLINITVGTVNFINNKPLTITNII